VRRSVKFPETSFSGSKDRRSKSEMSVLPTTIRLFEPLKTKQRMKLGLREPRGVVFFLGKVKRLNLSF
jgi:hypothetical protein